MIDKTTEIHIHWPNKVRAYSAEEMTEMCQKMVEAARKSTYTYEKGR